MGRRAAGFLIFRKLNEQIEYLLLKASYGSKHWTPPKDQWLRKSYGSRESCILHTMITCGEGHVDPGEDDFTTALRETKEEAGYAERDLLIHKDKMKVLSYEVYFKGQRDDKIVTYWLAEVINPRQDPILSDEHTEFRWLPKKDAVELSGFKDFQEMVEYFDDQIKTL